MTNVNFEKSEYIILGLKDKDGNLYSYTNSLSKVSIEKVEINMETEITKFSVFPYDVFSSLDDEHVSKYTKTYLKVTLIDKLSKKELKDLKSSGIMYYQFGKRIIKVIEEYLTPFQYALNLSKDKRRNLSTYSLTTWLIHEYPKSDEEFEAMKEILNIALNSLKHKNSFLDFSLDKYVLKYVEFLRNHNKGDKVSFGRYGRVFITKEDIIRADKLGELSVDDVAYIVGKVFYTTPLYYHSKLTTDMVIDMASKDENALYSLIMHIEKKEINEISSLGFDIDKLFSVYYSHKFGNRSDCYYGNYESVDELVSDSNYELYTETFDPYEFYCCSDCDGYELDDDDVEYDRQVDQQVEIFRELIVNWEEHLTDKSKCLFKNWSSDIFNRYSSEYGKSEFINTLMVR